MPPTSARHHAPVRYAIRVQGHLDPRWSAWFDGMDPTGGEDGTTTLHGPVADQAALHGVLEKLRDLGLPLLAVNEVPPDGPPPAPRPL